MGSENLRPYEGDPNADFERLAADVSNNFSILGELMGHSDTPPDIETAYKAIEEKLYKYDPTH